MKEFNKSFNRIFVTGDIHGDYFDLRYRVGKIPDASKDDLLIILGDCAFFYHHYYGDTERDYNFQELCAELPVTILAIQGNQEVPYREMPADRIKLFGGDGFESRGIYFAENGAELRINDKSFLVIGGAYSVDKDIRLLRGYAWWENEELTDTELSGIEKHVAGKKYDYVLTHACPYSNLPKEVFLPGVDQSKILNRTEKSLDRIKGNIKYKQWYCGHFHTDKIDGDIIFLFGGLRRII